MSRAVFVNLAPPSPERPDRAANRTIGALAHEYRPRLLACVEAVGRVLDPVPGYGLIRDRSRPGRANVALYVREDCQLRRHWFVDHRETWTRTEDPLNRPHPARATLAASVGNVQVLVGHQCPLGTDNTQAAQQEGVNVATRLMTPWALQETLSHAKRVGGLTTEEARKAMLARPRIMLWDPNRDPLQRGVPGPAQLASRIGGWAHGFTTDGAVTRQLTVKGDGYVKHADGVEVVTDHPGAYLLQLGSRGVTWGAL